MRSASLLILSISCLTASAALAGPPLESFLGTWVGPDLEPTPAPDGSTAYLRRSVTFTPDLESLQLEVFADAEATQRLFTYQSSEPYAFGPASAAVPGAWEIDLTNDSSLVTIHVDAPELWQGINLGACPLVIGTPVEISGCASGPPFNSSGCVDMDLLNVTEIQLRFGNQETDRCEERPTELDEAVYVRAP